VVFSITRLYFNIPDVSVIVFHSKVILHVEPVVQFCVGLSRVGAVGGVESTKI